MTLAPLEGHIDVPPFQANAADLFSAQSYLVDRVVPNCEQIRLPARAVPGGQIRYRTVSDFPAPAAAGRRQRMARLLERSATRTEPLQGRVGIDLRVNSPENWAHFLTNHLPLTFLLCQRAGLSPQEMTVLLPTAIPDYVLGVARLLGLQVQLTDAAVSGPGIGFDLDNWNTLRPLRRKWIVTSGILKILAGAIAAQDTGARRIFLPRRDTRCLTNQSQIEAILSAQGYVTVYPETLDPAEQFALFHYAEEIVAVHGAGLAPLLYRQADTRLQRLVEILPCGHMTDVYRVICQQVGCGWTGVRGRIKSKYVKDIYRIGTPFTRYSLDPFEADPLSLEQALSAARAWRVVSDT